jgi:hypothetical protein
MIKVIIIASLCLILATKDCFKGFYDLWGGEAGDTEFTVVDASPSGNLVLACGYSSSNQDGFVQFDS